MTIQFTILEDGAINVFKESHVSITDSNGIIIVNIGEGNVINGSFNNINWGGFPHYLKTEIDYGNGLTDMGTTEFKAVPYALYAENTASSGSGNTDMQAHIFGKIDSSGDLVQSASSSGFTASKVSNGIVQITFTASNKPTDKDGYIVIAVATNNPGVLVLYPLALNIVQEDSYFTITSKPDGGMFVDLNFIVFKN